MQDGEEKQRPEVPATINEYFMPIAKRPRECDSDGQVTSRPVWIAQAEVRGKREKYNFSTKTVKAAEINEDDMRGSSVRWEDYMCDPFDLHSLLTRPEYSDAIFDQIPEWMKDEKTARVYESDFENYLFRDADIMIWCNENIGVLADVDDTEDEFLKKCHERIEDLSTQEIEKLKKAHDAQTAKLEAQLKKLNVLLEERQSQVKQHSIQTLAAAGEFILALIQKRQKSISPSISKVTQTTAAKKAQEKVELDIEVVNREMQSANEDYERKLKEISEKWDNILEENKQIKITVNKNDIFVDAFGICWLPYYTNSAGKLVKAY